MEANETQVQTATTDFFVPIALAYIAVCVVWLVTRAVAQSRWEEEPHRETERPWLDFGMIFVAAISVLGIGQVYRQGWLLPALPGAWGNLTAAINLCIPYVPLFLIVAIRRQPLDTVWISKRALPWKIGTGILAALVGVFVFYGARAELERLPEVVTGLMKSRSWVHAPAVFLEAVAVAFIFVRLRWVSNSVIAIAVPCTLFALAHVPSGFASDRPLWEIGAFFVFNSALAALIFSVVMRSRDVIWIAIPHFVLDIAIRAFD